MKTRLFLFIAVLLSAFTVNAQLNSVAIVGNAVGGWPSGAAGEVDSKQLTRVTPAGNDWILENLVVTEGIAGATDDLGLKFRGNNAWTVPYNWGKASSGNDYPSNTCTIDGGDIRNIPAGTYTVLFNSATGVYNFTGGLVIPVVKLIGTSLAPATELAMIGNSLTQFEVTTDLVAGNAQFNIDGVVSGGTAFPGPASQGTATQFIPVTAGKWKVSLDLSLGEYKFEPISSVITVAIVGNATPAGWPGSATNPGPIDAQKMTNASDDNENYYYGELPLTAPVVGVNGSGELKFRINNAWANAAGGGSFPTGPTAATAGNNIIVTTAGTYSVDFVRSTGVYNFYTPKISLTGAAFLGWGNDVFLNTTDGITYIANNVIATNNEFKFRLDGRYIKSWGGTTFPVGTGSTVGGVSNISATAGTYNVTFNRLTGEYSFTPSLATTDFSVKLFNASPNPTSNNWKIGSTNTAITAVQVVDVLGKVVFSSNTISNEINVDASGLTNGIYFARVASSNGVETVKLIKN